MPAASNSLMRSMMRSCPIGSVQKARHESETHPKNAAAPTLGEHNEIVLRDYLGYFSGSHRVSRERGVLHSGERSITI
jgi:hypothetical protein